MIYYPLSVLMLAGIREILIISTPKDTPRFESILGDGTQWGLKFQYAVQETPAGLGQAFTIGRNFIGEENVCLVLGDNIFYGHDLQGMLRNAAQLKHGAKIFAYAVSDPERYGVVSFNKEGRVQTLEEKPSEPKSRYAVTGLYFYDNRVIEFAESLKPSARGELEITDINARYLAASELMVETMGRGYAWLDTGTHESMLDAAQFIETIERRQGLKVACPEEIAFHSGWIDATQLSELARRFGKSSYGEYLSRLARHGRA